MMTRRSDSFVLMLLMAVALMVGCGEGRTPRALVLADSLMNSRPDYDLGEFLFLRVSFEPELN